MSALRDFPDYACRKVSTSLDCTRPFVASADAEGRDSQPDGDCVLLSISHLVRPYSACCSGLSDSNIVRANRQYQETLPYRGYIEPYLFLAHLFPYVGGKRFRRRYEYNKV